MLFLFGLLVGSSGENGNGNKSGNGLECLLKVARVLRAWDSGPSSLTDTEVVDLEAGEWSLVSLPESETGSGGLGGGVASFSTTTFATLVASPASLIILTAYCPLWPT